MNTGDLVQAAQGGDEAAFEQIFLRFHLRLAKIIQMQLGRKLRSVEAVEDILQETFAMMWRDLGQYQPRSDAHFLDWLSTIAMNCIRSAAEFWSRKKRDPSRVRSIDSGPDEDIARKLRELTSQISGPMTRAMRQDDAALLMEAIDALPEQYRDAIRLRDYIGFDFAEIAERLDCPSEGAAREIHRRARAKLAIAFRGLRLGEDGGRGE